MPKPRTRDPAEKRRRIAAAALRLFSRHGYDGTSTAAVAEAAGVSEGLLFHHFASKEGLLEACGAEGIRELAEAQLAGVAHEGPPDYRRMIDATFAWVARDRAIGRLWAKADARLEAPLTRGLRAALIPPLTEMLQRLQAAGHVRPGNVALFAGLQFAVVGEALLAHFHGQTELALDQVIDEAARVVEAIAAPDG